MRSDADLEKARELVRRAGSFTGLGGGVQQMRPKIARVVAEGIALGREEGRREGIDLAAKAIAELQTPSKNSK